MTTARARAAAPTTPASSPSVEGTHRSSGLGRSIHGVAAIPYSIGEILAQLLGQTSTDDDQLDVDHVDNGSDPDAEHLDGHVEDLHCQTVLLGQRPGPHFRRQLVLALVVTDVEQRGLPTGVDHRRRGGGHRPTACVGLDTPPTRAAAQRAAGLDHHMADLAGRPAGTVEGSAVEHQRPADPGSHPHAQDVVDVTGCTGDPFAEQTHVHIVAQRHRHIERRFELRTQIHLVDPVRQVRAPSARFPHEPRRGSPLLQRGAARLEDSTRSTIVAMTASGPSVGVWRFTRAMTLWSWSTSPTSMFVPPTSTPATIMLASSPVVSGGVVRIVFPSGEPARITVCRTRQPLDRWPRSTDCIKWCIQSELRRKPLTPVEICWRVGLSGLGAPLGRG